MSSTNEESSDGLPTVDDELPKAPSCEESDAEDELEWARRLA